MHSCMPLALLVLASAAAAPQRRLSLSPTLCVCVLSHRRLDLLNRTLTAIVSHLETVERGLPYELVWVDNGSDEAERHALHASFAFEKALLLGSNYGMAFGLNQGHTWCTATPCTLHKVHC